MNAVAPGSAYDGYVEQWLAHEPELRVARTLVAALREPGLEARLVLESLLLDAAIEVRDTSLAIAKLDWWRAELAAAATGAARHPVALKLVELGHAAWYGDGRLVRAAVAIAALESPADVDALCAEFRAFARASLGDAVPEATVDALAVATLLARARRWPGFAQASRARIPLALLARLGVTRDAVLRDRVAAAAVLAALVDELAARLPARATGDAAAATRIAAAAQLAAAMRRAPDAALEGGARPRPLALLFTLWRTARRAAS